MAARYSLTWNIQRLRGITDAAVAAGLNETNELAAELASGFSPVRTGALRDSWEPIPAHRIGPVWRGGFRSTVAYAAFVDKGTRFMAPRHMTSRAIDIAFPHASRRMAAHWG